MRFAGVRTRFPRSPDALREDPVRTQGSPNRIKTNVEQMVISTHAARTLRLADCAGAVQRRLWIQTSGRVAPHCE